MRRADSGAIATYLLRRKVRLQRFELNDRQALELRRG